MSDTQQAQYSSGKNSKFVNQTHENIKFNEIIISDDKLENILLKHLDGIESNKAWIAPLGLFISLLLTLTTAKFESSTMGLDSSVWHAIFVLSTFGSLIWLGYTGFQAIKNYRKFSIDNLIKRIKNQE